MPKIKIKSLNTELNKRIRLIKTSNSVVDIGPQLGAVIDTDDYVGICLSPADVPPVISCEGSIDWFDIHHFVKIDQIPDPSYSTLKIDGVIFGENDVPPPWITVSEIAPATPPQGYVNLGSMRWTSSDTSSHIFEMEIHNDIMQVLVTNTAGNVVEFKPYEHYGVCLVHQGGSVPEGCEGALQKFGLAIGYYVPDGGNQDTWIVAQQVRLKFDNDEIFVNLDGTTPPYTGSYPEIGNFFNAHVAPSNGDFSQAPFDGEISFWENMNPEAYVKFEYELLPVNQTQFRVATFGDNAANDNVTPIFTRTCLSPYVSPISCEGAESSVEMAFAIKEGSSVPLSIVFLLDNQPVDLLNSPPPYISREILNKTYDGFIPAGFNVGAGVIKFTNTDVVEHRIECFTTDFENIRVLANHNSTVINLDPEIEWLDVGVCLGTGGTAPVVKGLYTLIPTSQVNMDGLTFNVNFDGNVWTNLPYSGTDTGIQGTWNNVPFVIGVDTEASVLYVHTIGSLPIDSLTISGPNVEFNNASSGGLPPDASTFTISGTGLGNTATTQFMEYVGNEVTGNTVYLNAAWVTSNPFSLGINESLEGVNTGNYHETKAVGRTTVHATVTEALDWYNTTIQSSLGGMTLPDATGLQFTDDGSGNFQITNTNSYEVTLYLRQSSSNFSGAFNAESDSLASMRGTGTVRVLRLRGGVA